MTDYEIYLFDSGYTNIFGVESCVKLDTYRLAVNGTIIIVFSNEILGVSQIHPHKEHKTHGAE